MIRPTYGEVLLFVLPNLNITMEYKAFWLPNAVSLSNLILFYCIIVEINISVYFWPFLDVFTENAVPLILWQIQGDRDNDWERLLWTVNLL